MHTMLGAILKLHHPILTLFGPSSPRHPIIFSCTLLSSPIDDVPTWSQSSDNSCQLAIDSWQFIVDRCITTVVYSITLEIKFYLILINSAYNTNLTLLPPSSVIHSSSFGLLPLSPYEMM